MRRESPVLLELFTSQGCASCVPANALLGEFARTPGVIALTYGVAYWDYLGWRDTFAKPEFATRQRSYASALHQTGVYTPEIVVDGAADASGADRARILTLMARPESAGARITPADRGRVVVTGPTPSAPADVWLIRYLPQPAFVPVKRGENAGVTMPHYNVVTNVLLLGQWRGGAAVFNATCPRACVLVVQTARAGPVLAVRRSPF